MQHETFKGTNNVYTVVADADPVFWGLSVTLTPQQEFLVRFATLGITTAPPKHFNFRMAGEFTGSGANDEVGPGIYYDRSIFKVVPTTVPRHTFEAICIAMDIPAILGEWVVRQFKKEGVDVDVEKVTNLFVAAYAPNPGNVAPCFKIPKDIYHELKVGDVPLTKGSQED
jgi:hypothetical protein